MSSPRGRPGEGVSHTLILGAVRMRMADPITSTVPDQRRDMLVCACRDFADEKHMIAGGMQRVVAAFQPRNTTFDERRIRGSEPIRDTGEAVGVWTREAACQLDLIVREHVDGIALCALEHDQAA